MLKSFALFILVGTLIAATSAIAADEADFDRVFTSAYDDILFKAKTAYQGKRYDEAFPLMKQAACAGDKESQWMLGHMYLLGQGVPRDDMTGYGWLKVAAEFNSAEYHRTVDTIEKAIDPQQLPAAQAEARTFVDNYGLRSTHMSCNRAASQHGHIMDRIVCTPRYDGQLALLRKCVADAPAVGQN